MSPQVPSLTKEAVEAKVLSGISSSIITSVTTEKYATEDLEQRFRMTVARVYDDNGVRLFPRPSTPIWVTIVQGSELKNRVFLAPQTKIVAMTWGEGFSHAKLTTPIQEGDQFSWANDL